MNVVNYNKMAGFISFNIWSGSPNLPQDSTKDKGLLNAKNMKLNLKRKSDSHTIKTLLSYKKKLFKFSWLHTHLVDQPCVPTMLCSLAFKEKNDFP